MAPKGKSKKPREESEFKEVTLDIRRVMRVTKGGRQLRFSALVVVGDENGRVGYGLGKAGEVSVAITKAAARAKKSLVQVNITRSGTIPHPVKVTYKSSKIMMMPASEGTGVIAGSFIRTVCELAGIRNILSKSFGSSNKIAGVMTTIKAFSELRAFTPKKPRITEEVS